MKKLTLILIAFVISTFIHAQCDHDATNPWFDNLVTDITVECNDDLSFLIPDAFDDCDTLVDIAWYEEITPDDWCSNSFTIFRVYRAYDDFGNQVVESQTVYVVDETPPTFLSLFHKSRVSLSGLLMRFEILSSARDTLRGMPCTLPVGVV